MSASHILSLAVAILVVIHLVIYALGIRQMTGFRALSLHAKGCSLFVNVLNDECFTDAVFPRLDELKRYMNAADRLGFIRPGLVKSNRVEDIAGSQQPGPDNVGAFQTLSRGEDGGYVAAGWSKLPGRAERADVVLLAYSVGDNPPVVFAIARSDPERDWVSSLIGRGIYGPTRWSRSFSPDKISPKRARLSAWAFDALNGKAYKLEGVHDFQNLPGSPRTNANESLPR